MPTAKATHTTSGTVLASSSSADYVIIEGNIYFPTSSLSVSLPSSSSDGKAHLSDSKTHYTCPWKGVSSYYNLVLGDGTQAKDIGWYYTEPKQKAADLGIKDTIAWDKRQVKVEVED